VPDNLASIKIGDITIKKVQAAKYLGVTLDENLNWNEHISNLNSSLIKLTNSFKIIKHQIPECNKLMFYYAYIYSKIQYGIEVYGMARPSALKKVQIRQNRSIKTLYSKDYLTPTKALHKDINILLVQDIYRHRVLKFVYKQQNNLLPKIFDKFYTTKHNIHSHNTRQKNGLYLTQATSNYGLDSIEHQGILLWNLLPNQTRTLTNIKSFSRTVKHDIITTY
jgi:hypothetical protein